MKTFEKVLFDTNVLIAAHDNDNPNCEKARELITQVASYFLEGYLAQQNITEFISAITNPKRIVIPLELKLAIREAKKYLSPISGFKIISPVEKTLPVFLELVMASRLTKTKVFDAYLVATMITNGVFTLYTTNDQDFKKFADKIKIINPFKSK